MNYQIAYNPYKVDMKISIRDKNEWVPISPNSTLVQFSRIRLQRCLNNHSDNSFFYELCKSSGDDEIEILFLGTDEDYADFQEAVSNFNFLVSDYNIELRKEGTSSSNSTKSKYDALLKLTTNAKKYKYNYLITDKIWKGIDNALTKPSSEAVLIPLEQWKNYKEKIFSRDSWKMFCFEFRYEDLKSKSIRNAFRELSKEFEQLPDRPFERERFEFICRYDNNTKANYNVLKKALMEYGIQDIGYALINETDYTYIDDPESQNASASLKELQQHIVIFKKRYASQYKLRKSIDSIQFEIQKEELTPGPNLKRKVDDALKERKTGSSNLSDREVEDAYDWLVNTLNSISHILELET